MPAERREIESDAIRRANEIGDFLRKNVKLPEGESINCEVFYEPASNTKWQSTSSDDGVLTIYAWISTDDPAKLYSRPLPEDLGYPQGWHHQRPVNQNRSETYYDAWYLEPEIAAGVRKYRSGDIIWPVDMLDHTSD